MSNKLDAYYGLPNEVKFCKKCTISNQRPSSTIEFKSEKGEKKKVINFNEDSVCSACVYHDEKETGIDWNNRDDKLRELLSKFKSNDGSYDVIIPGSGGKDSAFTAHILKYKYGMNPLAVTWSPLKATGIGRQNLDAFIASGFDHILGTPNRKVTRQITNLAFKHVGDPFQPFIYGQTNFPLHMAVKYKVPLIMYGENGEVEYGGDMKNDPQKSQIFRHIEFPFDGKNLLNRKLFENEFFFIVKNF